MITRWNGRKNKKNHLLEKCEKSTSFYDFLIQFSNCSPQPNHYQLIPASSFLELPPPRSFFLPDYKSFQGRFYIIPVKMKTSTLGLTVLILLSLLSLGLGSIIKKDEDSSDGKKLTRLGVTAGRSIVQNVARREFESKSAESIKTTSSSRTQGSTQIRREIDSDSDSGSRAKGISSIAKNTQNSKKTQRTERKSSESDSSKKSSRKWCDFGLTLGLIYWWVGTDTACSWKK